MSAASARPTPIAAGNCGRPGLACAAPAAESSRRSAAASVDDRSPRRGRGYRLRRPQLARASDPLPELLVGATSHRSTADSVSTPCPHSDAELGRISRVDLDAAVGGRRPASRWA